jgi:preprotein translocase subunit YajC
VLCEGGIACRKFRPRSSLGAEFCNKWTAQLTTIFSNLSEFVQAMPSSLLLAQAPLPQAEEVASPGIGSMLAPLIAIMVFFYFLILRPQKNKEQALRNLVANLKEKDRVVTIGGIHGVVTNVQRDRDEVTIRVDETTGTKIRVNTSAVARVVTEETKTEV